MLNSIREMSECSDDVLQPAAARILTTAAAEPELNEDNTMQMIEQFIDGKMPSITGKFITFQVLLKVNFEIYIADRKATTL